MNLLDLMIKVGVDDQATAKIGGIASEISSKAGMALKAGAAVATATVAATGAVTSALASNVKEVAEYGDNIDKMSQKMGMSAEAYQEWDAVMQHSGTSMESMKAGMKTLANAAETGNDAFQKIGLTQEQIASMSQEQLFEATITGLQNVSDTTERTYLAGQLLGRGATELGALLNTSAEDTQAMRDRVHELGGVMSDEAVKSAAAFQDSLQDLNTAITGIKNKVFGEFMPSITEVMDGLQEVLAGNPEEGLEKIEQGFQHAIEKLNEMLPTIIEMGGRIIFALVQGILMNIPGLIKAFGEALVSLINQMADNTDAMVEGAIQLFGAIGEAIAEVAPQLLVALGKLLVNLVASIIMHVPDFLAAAAQAMMALLQGIVQGITPIMETMNNIVQGILDSVGNAVQNMFTLGANLIQGLINGIVSNITGVGDALMGGLRGAVDSARSFLGIHSPSKLFEDMMALTMKGAEIGITSNTGMLTDAVESAASSASDAFRTSFAGDVGIGVGDMASGTAQPASAGPTVNVYVEARDDDPYELGRRIGQAVSFELRMQGVTA